MTTTTQIKPNTTNRPRRSPSANDIDAITEAMQRAESGEAPSSTARDEADDDEALTLEAILR